MSCFGPQPLVEQLRQGMNLNWENKEIIIFSLHYLPIIYFMFLFESSVQAQKDLS